MNFLRITCIYAVFFLNTHSFFCSAASAGFEEATKILSHYDITYRTSGLFETADCEIGMNEFINSLSGRIDVDEDFKKLLSGCEVRENGVITTARGSTVYFVRKKPQQHKTPQTSHWVIKQLPPYDGHGENEDLELILQCFREKNALSLGNNNCKISMPECTFTVRDANGRVLNCTLYHRVKFDTFHETLRTKLRSPNSDTHKMAAILGKRIFALHDSLRPTKEELETLSNVTGEINVSKMYEDSASESFSGEPVLLKHDNPLTRLMVTRCMGDMHTRNIMASGMRLALIDYLSLARDTKGRNNFSSFTNDISYFMYCCVYFYGRDFIQANGIEFLANFLLGYLVTVHQDYRQDMLDHIKQGFLFFVNELTVDPVFKSTTNYSQEARTRYINSVISDLNTILFKQHGVTVYSSDDAIEAAISEFNTTKAKLKQNFIDSILARTSDLLSQTPWEETQKKALEKVIARRQAEKPSHYVFATEQMPALLERLSSEQQFQKFDERKQKLPPYLSCALSGTQIHQATQQNEPAFTIVRNRVNHSPRITAWIYGPYQQQEGYIAELKTLRDQSTAAQSIARINGNKATELNLPNVIKCADGYYFVYQGYGELQSAENLLRLSQPPATDFPEHEQPKTEYHLSAFRNFGEQLFILHSAARNVYLPPEEINKQLGRPVHPAIVNYLLVPSVAPDIGNVFFSINNQRTLIDCRTTQVLSSREKFTHDVYGFIKSAFEHSKTDTTVALVAAFLDGYLSGAPKAIVTEHMLPDLRLNFMRGNDGLFAAVIAQTKFRYNPLQTQ